MLYKSLLITADISGMRCGRIWSLNASSSWACILGS